jgi:hypothetical protein
VPDALSGSCIAVVASQDLCDPRALCQPATSGGVECTCVGEGLDFRPGFPTDGQRCVQQTSIQLQTQTSRVAITVEKPSSRTEAVAVVFAAAGETGFTVSYNMSMTRVPMNDVRSQLQGPNATARGWSAIDLQRMSMDGHHVIWQGTPPSADGAVDLSYEALRFSSSKTFGLSIELNCKPGSDRRLAVTGESCVEDGDIVHTLVTAMSASDRLVAEVMISTTVESLASCSRSSARLQGPATVDPSTDILRLDASLVDVDNLPIRISSPKVYAVWNNETFLLERVTPGSNRFRWEIPSSLRRKPGWYNFEVFLELGWDEVLAAKKRCRLHEGTVKVAKGFDTTWVLIGSILAAIILIGVALFVVGRYHEQLMNIAVMLITEVVKLGFSISLEIGNVITEYALKIHHLFCSAYPHCACSIFAAKTVLFDDSLGLSIELRTAYAFSIILSMVVAAVSILCRIYSAQKVHQVRRAHGTPGS